MKRTGILLFILLAGLMISAAAAHQRVYSLKIVSKADLEVGVQLVEVEDKRAYYFLLDAAGSPSFPVEATYAIERGIYTMSIYYIEDYDPVYGDICEDPGSQTLYMNRNVEVIVKPCKNNGEAIIRNRGESPKIKVGTVK